MQSTYFISFCSPCHYCVVAADLLSHITPPSPPPPCLTSNISTRTPSPIHIATMMMRLFSFFVLLVFQLSFGLQFYLEEGQTLCFGENIAPNAKVLGEYTVAAGNGHMPVDIVVRDLPENTTLLERSDINHGKFAFIMPFGQEAPKIHTAELHRTEGHHHGSEHHDTEHRDYHHDEHEVHHDAPPPEHDHGHDWDNHHPDDLVHHRQTRSLLSYERENDGLHHHDDNEHHEYHRDAEREHQYHEHHDEGVEHLKKLDHMDAHDGEHEDMDDHWDMDKYDGIHDEELDKDWIENEKHAPHHHNEADDEEDDEEMDDMFKDRKVEICISNRSPNRNLRRRVRIIIRHGKTAHDYTSLAKKENLSSLELTLRIVSDELKWLLSELDHARQMEDALRKLNETTSRRVVHYATLSLIVLLGVAAFQAMYTKRFFKTKKLL